MTELAAWCVPGRAHSCVFEMSLRSLEFSMSGRADWIYVFLPYLDINEKQHNMCVSFINTHAIPYCSSGMFSPTGKNAAGREDGTA